MYSRVRTVVAGVGAADAGHGTASGHDELVVVTHVVHRFGAADHELVEVKPAQSFINL